MDADLIGRFGIAAIVAWCAAAGDGGSIRVRVVDERGIVREGVAVELSLARQRSALLERARRLDFPDLRPTLFPSVRVVTDADGIAAFDDAVLGPAMIQGEHDLVRVALPGSDSPWIPVDRARAGADPLSLTLPSTGRV